MTFEAHGDAVSYRWELGNGETAEGPTASTTYGPGLWTAAVTATAADGATAQATVVVRSVAIALRHGFTPQVILNAQLQSILSLESYAGIAKTPVARRVVSDLVVAARRLLPRFEMGCWARYELGGGAASLHYQTYHVDLLRRLAATSAEPIWRNTYVRRRRCLP